MQYWATIDPVVAEVWRIADLKYEKAKFAARNLPLAEKVIAINNAKIERKRAYYLASKSY